MTEEADLQAKIAALAGKINQRKQQQLPPPHGAHQFSPPPRRGYRRWGPYNLGGSAGYAAPHRNRTLVLSGNPPAPPSTNTDPATAALSDSTTATANAFVSTWGHGKSQLMNKNTYEREQKQKLVLAESQRMAKRQKVDNEQKAMLVTVLAQGSREMVVDGMRFQLRPDGSKLMRIMDDGAAAKETPKRVKIANVDFHRTKHGNLVRALAVKDLNRPKQKPQCKHFTKHGNCPFGPTCRFSHDPEKVAICKSFLHAGSCPSGKNCDLSHEPTYHRVPACTHFLRGNCINDACRYPHVHVSPSAPVCRAFVVGYCSKGPDCEKRHVIECPDYANHGYCADRESGKCSLPHPDRASTLRKAAERQAKTGSEAESDVSSEEDDEGDTDFEDVDSDDADNVIIGNAAPHDRELAQDFISL